MEKSEEKRDYTLLRPFDPEAAKRGEGIQLTGFQISDISFRGVLSSGRIVLIEFADKSGTTMPPERLRMSPLAWVEGKPVYPGDELYYIGSDFGMRVTGYNLRTPEKTGFEGTILKDSKYYEADEKMWAPFGAWTWQKPKTKREGWVNVYRAVRTGRGLCSLAGPYGSKEQADKVASSDRIDCVQLSWED